MKTLWVRLIVLSFISIVTSFVDVQYRAQAHQSRPDCLTLQKACSLLGEKPLQLIPLKQGTLRISKGSSVKFDDEGIMTLIRGQFSLESISSVKVKTLYASIEVKEGEALLQVKDMIVNLTNLSGKVTYTPRGEKNPGDLLSVFGIYDLPKGYSIYFSGITEAGVAKTGFPHPAAVDPLIRTWASLYLKSEKNSLKDKMKEFMISWSEATELASRWYRETYLNEIEKHEAEQRRWALLRAQKAAENEKWKSLFRKRNYIGTDSDSDADEVFSVSDKNTTHKESQSNRSAKQPIRSERKPASSALPEKNEKDIAQEAPPSANIIEEPVVEKLRSLDDIPLE